MFAPFSSRTARYAAAFTFASFLLTNSPALAAIEGRDILIKSSSISPSVFYLAEGGQRYVFPDDMTFNSWFMDFSNVTEVTAEDLMSFPIAGNITYRPGINLVKFTTDSRVFATGAGGELRMVSDAVAEAIYG